MSTQIITQKEIREPVYLEVVDTFEMAGLTLYVVKAHGCKPFVGGDTYPVRTEWATLETAEYLEWVQEMERTNELIGAPKCRHGLFLCLDCVPEYEEAYPSSKDTWMGGL